MNKSGSVLEVNVDTAVRSKRKEKDLKALSELLTKEEEKPNKDNEKGKHKSGGDVKAEKKHDTKHNKKHKKKKHRS